MRSWPSGSSIEVISEIRRVFRIASGWSGKSWAIWAALFSQKSRVSNFIRPGVSMLLPVPTQSRTSWASAWGSWT